MAGGALVLGGLLEACSAPTPAASATAAPVSTAAAPAAKPAAGTAVEQLTTVKMGQTGLSPASWPLYVVQVKGFLADEGLVVDSTVLSSSTSQSDALLTGDVNFNTYSVDSVARPVANGAALKYIATAQAIPNFQLIVGKDINSWADLKGKTLASGSAAGYFDIVMKAMLAANGLKFPGDYNVVSMGNSTDRLPALQTGQIQGMIVGSPDDSQAIAAGFKSLGYVNQYLSQVEYNGYAVSDAWAKANSDTVVRFLRGMQKGVDFLFDPANKTESLKIYGDVSKLEPQYVDSIYDQLINQKMLSRDQRPNPTAIINLLTLSVQNGGIDAIPPLDTWIDTSYLDKAQGKS